GVYRRLRATRVGRPSRLASPAAAVAAAVAKLCSAPKEGAVAPGAVVFSSTDAVLEPKLARRRSGRPSPLTSAAATEYGLRPVAKVCWVAKEAAVAPGAVVFSSTDTVVEPRKARGRTSRERAGAV